MEPRLVNHAKFRVEHVVFDDGLFSIVSGTYEGGRALGARWNGDPSDPHSLGYPSSRGRAVWFVVEDSVAQAVLGGLAAAVPDGTDTDALAAVLKLRHV